MKRLTGALDRGLAGRFQFILVSGEAGIGKTTLLSRLVEHASAGGATSVWATCWHADQAPGFWPWAQVVRHLADEHPSESLATGLGSEELSQLARLAPQLNVGHAPAADDDPSDHDRHGLFTGVTFVLDNTARLAPVVVVLDDLQWADASSLELLQFVARRPRPVPLVVIGAYRHDELEPGSAQARRLAELSSTAEHLRLAGLDDAEVEQLVRQVAGETIAARWASDVSRRSGGHPLFVKELSHLLASHPDPDAWLAVPAAIQDVIGRRLARLSPGCVRMLQVAAVCGNHLLVDVLAELCGCGPAQIVDLEAEAVRAGILSADDPLGGRARFAHDLFRETLYEGLAAGTRRALHHRVGDALERRHATSSSAHPAEIARHFAAAIALDGAERALRWAVTAARTDSANLAFAESADHIERLRKAAQANGVTFAPETMVDLLVMEADGRVRGGDPGASRILLERARQLARDLPDPERLASVALGLQRLGTRTAMPRDDVVSVLDEARAALGGTNSAAEAQVTASLARELAHSVRAEQARARPLSERALEVARRAGDPATMALCLLARHDVVWGPGTASERLELAGEIVALAERVAQKERLAEGVLLRASALLELGSPAFRTEFERYLRLAVELRQPRYDYLALTRRASLALLDGRIGEAELLIEEAQVLGRRIAEPDSDNVFTSQTLAALWARGERSELLDFADRAVAAWVGVPTLSHAVSAACRVRAGDIDGARRALAVVIDLGDWRLERSPLPSAVGFVTFAAARLGERDLCEALYDDLVAVSTECAVFGAAVCFMGSYAHWAGVAAAALGRVDDALSHFERAATVHAGLGATTWEAATWAEMAALRGRAGAVRESLSVEDESRAARDRPGSSRARDQPSRATFRLAGPVWELDFGGRAASIPDTRGLRDIAVLLARPGRPVPVTELLGVTTGAPPSDVRGPATLDERAQQEIRRQLRALEAEIDDAESASDGERAAMARERRQALAETVARDLGLGGRARRLDDPVERARKTVSTRIRRATRRIESMHPELGRHLDRSIITGALCVYDPAEPVRWTT